jgi:hypothetical protein
MCEWDLNLSNEKGQTEHKNSLFYNCKRIRTVRVTETKPLYPHHHRSKRLPSNRSQTQQRCTVHREGAQQRKRECSYENSCRNGQETGCKSFVISLRCTLVRNAHNCIHKQGMAASGDGYLYLMKEPIFKLFAIKTGKLVFAKYRNQE